MHSEFCEHCGTEFRLQWGNNLRFCDDDCRYAWHNTKRKLQRKLDTITKCLLDLQEISAMSDEWLHEVGETMKSIKNIVEHGDGYQFLYKCIKCGGYHYGIPARLTQCKDCQSSSDKLRLVKSIKYDSPHEGRED